MNIADSQKLKETEIGPLDQDWQVVSLGAHANFKTGPFGSALHKSDYVDGGIPVINPMQIVDSKLVPTRSMAISEEARDKLSEFQLRAGNVVIGRRGEMGRCAVVPSEADGWLCGTGSVAIRPKSTLDGSYLQRQLSSPSIIHAITSTSVGTTMINLNQSTLSNLRIPLPPTLAEQQAIAEALGDADAWIESLEGLIAKKRHLKQAAMQQLLTGKTRLPGFEGEWETERIGTIAKIQRGASPRPIDSPIWFDENSKIGWVRISDVTRVRKYLYETTQRLSMLGIQNSRPVSRGSLIMSICATVGRPIITEIDVCIHDGFVVFDDLQIDRNYMYYFLTDIEKDWSRHGQTGSQMNLNTDLIRRTKVRVPSSREEQVAIADILTDMDNEIAALEAKLAKARDIKQGMMQQLLTGKIRLV